MVMGGYFLNRTSHHWLLETLDTDTNRKDMEATEMLL